MVYLYFCLFFLFIPAISITLHSITPTKPLKDGDTLVSANEVLELGFFSPDENLGGKHRYLGIWYKQPPPRALVWVANREAPIKDLSGVLNISVQGNLLLSDGKNKVFWSSNASKPATNPILQLLPSGNLVLRDGNNGIENEESFLWQSFDYPFDTLLAGMKLGKNFLTGREWSLSSRKNEKDPASGRFSLLIDLHGFPQLVLKDGNMSYYRLGSWNGLTFTGTPEIRQADNFFRYEFMMSAEQVTYTWESQIERISMLVLNQSGFLGRFIQTQTRWIPIYSAPLDQCDYYSVCGAHAICKINKLPSLCSCLDGFVPKSPQKWKMSKWSGGCVRAIQLDCGRNDEFRKYGGLKLPDTTGSWYDTKMSLAECKDKCLKNCSCMAYANSNIREGGNGCLLWFGDLKDTREYSEGGQDVYIRMAIPKPAGLATRPKTRTKDVGIIVGSGVLISLVIVGLVVCWRRKIKKNRGIKLRNEAGGEDDIELPIFDMSTIAKATDDFSDTNFLGKGGFGPVYKGNLGEGQEIAVKRLSANSGQGVQEFKNEVKLIAKLQHRNLVRLLGCCIQGDERMLIYEYMPNKSLDYFIFDESRSKILDWPRRMNIIGGIARGLLYLHQDSRLRIIHRDLKAGNVLLDNDMNPKISDFGLAKSFGGDQIEAETNKVVGTYGYMSPEYAVDGHFSIKSDVFSFGVLVLEIVSGKKNRGFRHIDHDHNLLGHAWKLWIQERTLELTDDNTSSYVPSEVLRCVHVGLLCVQQKPEDRPNMANVILMLGSDGSLSQPKQPGFFTGRNLPAAESSSSVPSGSMNEVSMTQLQGR